MHAEREKYYPLLARKANLGTQYRQQRHHPQIKHGQSGRVLKSWHKGMFCDKGLKEFFSI